MLFFSFRGAGKMQGELVALQMRLSDWHVYFTHGFDGLYSKIAVYDYAPPLGISWESRAWAQVNRFQAAYDSQVLR